MFCGPERSLSFFVESPNLEDNSARVHYLDETWRLTSSYWIGKRTKRRRDTFNKGSSPNDNEYGALDGNTLQTFGKVNVADIETSVIIEVTAHLVSRRQFL